MAGRRPDARKGAPATRGSGKSARGDRAPGKGALSKRASGKGASGDRSPGNGASARRAPGKGALGDRAPRKVALAKRAPGKSAPGDGSPGKSANAKHASGKSALGDRSPRKVAPAKRAPGTTDLADRAPAKGAAPAQRALGESVLGDRAPAKGAPGVSAPRDRSPNNGAPAHRARSLARRLALQALYQIQINPSPWTDTQRQFADDPEADRVDLDYFRALIAAIAPNREALDSRLARLCEIPPPELDPIEHAVLWLGLHELESCPDLPYRVALAEAVQLTKQFGATDGHKFVNAVLDRAARELRPHEYGLGRV